MIYRFKGMLKYILIMTLFTLWNDAFAEYERPQKIKRQTQTQLLIKETSDAKFVLENLASFQHIEEVKLDGDADIALSCKALSLIDAIQELELIKFAGILSDEDIQNIEKMSVESSTEVSNKVILKSQSMRLGTLSENKEDRTGHIYGLHTFGKQVDSGFNEYPVGIDVVIMSIFNTINVNEDDVDNILDNGDNDDFEIDSKLEDEPDVFLTSNSEKNFDSIVKDTCVWEIKRVINMTTFDLDYLRDLDRDIINKKSMDNMVYCIKNKSRGKYLMNNFKSFEGANGKSNLNFSDTFIPKTCGWMIQRIEGHDNQYTLFSMSQYTNKQDDLGETLLDVFTGDFISPIYKSIRESMEFPFNKEFINPFFSSLSTNAGIINEQFGSFENSWTIVDLSNGGLKGLIDKSVKEVIDKKQREKALDYNGIRKSCVNDDDCVATYGEGAICEVFGPEEKHCVVGRTYGEFCSIAKNVIRDRVTSDCGKDSNGDQLMCRLQFNFDQMNVCRYPAAPFTSDRRFRKRQKEGDFCGVHEECEGYGGAITEIGEAADLEPLHCCGTEADKKMGKGICTKPAKDWLDPVTQLYLRTSSNVCPADCVGCVGGPKGTCDLCPTSENRKDKDGPCCYDHQCKETMICVDGKCTDDKIGDYEVNNTAQTGCTPETAVKAVTEWKDNILPTLREVNCRAGSTVQAVSDYLVKNKSGGGYKCKSAYSCGGRCYPNPFPNAGGAKYSENYPNICTDSSQCQDHLWCKQHPQPNRRRSSGAVPEKPVEEWRLKRCAKPAENGEAVDGTLGCRTARECKSGYKYDGTCVACCNENKENRGDAYPDYFAWGCAHENDPNNPGKQRNTQYCDEKGGLIDRANWECKGKLNNDHVKTGVAQVGCGNNGAFAKRCKSDWSCGIDGGFDSICRKKPPGKGAGCSANSQCTGHYDHCCYGKCDRQEKIGLVYWCPVDIDTTDGCDGDWECKDVSTRKNKYCKHNDEWYKCEVCAFDSNKGRWVRQSDSKTEGYCPADPKTLVEDVGEAIESGVSDAVDWLKGLR